MIGVVWNNNTYEWPALCNFRNEFILFLQKNSKIQSSFPRWLVGKFFLGETRCHWAILRLIVLYARYLSLLLHLELRLCIYMLKGVNIHHVYLPLLSRPWTFSLLRMYNRSKATQSTFSSFMINEAVIGAEIMLALDGVMSNYSLNSSSSTKCLKKCLNIARL